MDVSGDSLGNLGVLEVTEGDPDTVTCVVESLLVVTETSGVAVVLKKVVSHPSNSIQNPFLKLDAKVNFLGYHFCYRFVTDFIPF